jgi:hypothetical protein
MKRSTVARLIALLVLLVHGGAFGATSVLDRLTAARATNVVAHVEEAAGADCVAHDEATCQLCQFRNASGSTAPLHFVLPTLTRGGPPARTLHTFRGSNTPSALHSRAPPVA